MTVHAFLDRLNAVLPLEMALPGDPVGTQVLPGDRELFRVAAAYEVTETVAQAAIEHSVDLVVAFHPLIYTPLAAVRLDRRVDRTVVRLIQAGITVHVVHTILDVHPEGTNALLASGLGLREIGPLIPDDRRPGWGMGAIGTLPEPMTLRDVADLAKRVCGSPALRYSHGQHHGEQYTVGRVAVVGGSGARWIDDAQRRGADVFITADVRYHAFHDALDAIPIIDAGHAETERFVLPGLYDIVARWAHLSIAGIDVISIPVNTNPIITVS